MVQGVAIICHSGLKISAPSVHLDSSPSMLNVASCPGLCKSRTVRFTDETGALQHIALSEWWPKLRMQGQRKAVRIAKFSGCFLLSLVQYLGTRPRAIVISPARSIQPMPVWLQPRAVARAHCMELAQAGAASEGKRALAVLAWPDLFRFFRPT